MTLPTPGSKLSPALQTAPAVGLGLSPTRMSTPVICCGPARTSTACRGSQAAMNYRPLGRQSSASVAAYRQAAPAVHTKAATGCHGKAQPAPPSRTSTWVVRCRSTTQ